MERVILTTGGTGGHIFPALAVAEELRSRHPGVRILFVGGKRRPETTPALVLGPMPKGWPTATTWSPGRRSEVERMVAASRSSGSDWALSTARSFSGWGATPPFPWCWRPH